MIKTIKLAFFQSHRETTLNLSSGVNVLAGTSDSGKSAIIRALGWLTFNRPSGDGFRSFFAGKGEAAQIDVETMDGHSISRSRTKSVNTYVLDGEPMEAMGQDVPEAIRDALNLEATNFQTQMDPPFLLTLSGGQVARELNKLVRLEIMDASLSEASRRIRDTNGERVRAEGELSQVEADAITFEGLESAQITLGKLETRYKKLAGNRTALTELRELVRQIDAASVGKAPRTAFLAKGRVLSGVEAKNAASIARGGVLAGIRGLVDTIRAKREALRTIREESPSYSPEDLNGLEYSATGLTNKRNSISAVEGLVRDLVLGKEKLAERRERVADLQSELRGIIPDECPTCGQEITDDAKASLMR